jgi:hypothetical protein
MTKVRDYFKSKYDKKGPAYLQGVLRTIGELPHEDEELVPENKEVLEK